MDIIVGETYQAPNQSQYIFVLGISSETATGVNLAIYWVNPQTMETTGTTVIYVAKDELKSWKKLDL